MPADRNRALRRTGIVLGVLALAAGMITIGVRALLHKLDLPGAELARCELVGTPYELSTERAANAATVTAVAVRRKLPAEAAVIALAVALQESKLDNIGYGDRDSLGLFQQRPSQGWGTATQIMDPRYAAGRFYDHLVKVGGWETMPLTDAAQAVQRSGHPGAYAKWEDEARALAEALNGARTAGLSCAFPAPTVVAQPDRVVALLTAELPATPLASTERSAEIRPGSTAWASVSWLVAYADRLGVDAVGYAGQRWTRADGWRADPAIPADRIRLETAPPPAG